MIIRKDICLDSDSFPFNISTTSISALTKELEPIYHWHDCLEISYILKGEGSYTVNGLVYKMKPKDIILFNNIEPHSWAASSNSTMEVSSIVFDLHMICSNETNPFDSQYLQPFLHRNTNFTNKLHPKNFYTPIIYNLLLQITEEFTQRPIGYELMIKAKLLEMMTYLIRHFQDNNKTSEVLEQKEIKLLRLSEALDYVQQHYTSPISLTEVAGVACMNPSYFSSFFKETIGSSFVDYLTQLRIHHADQLLRTTDYKILDIALQSGFGSLSSFNRSFKKIKGISPSHFKAT